jgi:endonuclease/exonuclease/phosphatase family metal-dependent hydrolase
VETGRFAPADRVQAASNRLVIATFNIRYAVGPYLISGGLLRRIGIRLARERTEVVRANIETAAKAFSAGDLLPRPDLIALQEADHSTARSGGVNVARELAAALAMNYVHASTGLPRHVAEKRKQWYLDFEEHIKQSDAGDTGVALLSHYAIERPARIELPWQECPWRPRLAVAGTIEVGSSKLTVINSHIDPHAATGQQLAQHEKILSVAERANGPTLLLGDFNTLTPRSRRETRRLLEAHGFETPFDRYTATWRAGPYTQHADWIFVRGATVLRHGVARPLRVSDHWPVWAEIELPEDVVTMHAGSTAVAQTN